MLEPLSVTAAVAGLINATTTVARGVNKVLQKMHDAPDEIRKAGEEAAAMHLLFVQVQRFVQNPSLANPSHSGLISLDHIVVTLSACVKAFSMLDDFVRQLDSIADLNAWVRLRWNSKSEVLSTIMANIETQKSSLEIMLTLLTGSTTLEIKNSIFSQGTEISQVKESVDKLTSLVEVMLENNTFLARRLAMLEERSISQAASILEPSTNMSASVSKDIAHRGLAAASLWNEQLTMESPEVVQGQSQVYISLEERQFEEILQHSRPYRSALGLHDERLSFFSTGDQTGTWSVLSGLSLSQISSLTIIALPIYPQDITNASSYSFGVAESRRTMNEILNIRLGIEQIHATRLRLIALKAHGLESEDWLALGLRNSTNQLYERLLEGLHDLVIENEIGGSLLVELYESLHGAIELFRKAHINQFNIELAITISVLTLERCLSDWAVMNGNSEATVIPGGDISSIGSSPMRGMISPPERPRFPGGDNGIFENPRQPPPIPQSSLLSLPTDDFVGNMVSKRAVPSHSMTYHQIFVPTRAAPPPQVSKTMSLRRSPDATKGLHPYALRQNRKG